MTTLTREQFEVFGAYEQAQSFIRQRLSMIYRLSGGLLIDWQQFQADFAPGGRFDALVAQFAEDTSQLQQEQYATIQAALVAIRTTMQEMQQVSPGLFQIDDLPSGAVRRR